MTSIGRVEDGKYLYANPHTHNIHTKLQLEPLKLKNRLCGAWRFDCLFLPSFAHLYALPGSELAVKSCFIDLFRERKVSREKESEKETETFCFGNLNVRLGIVFLLWNFCLSYSLNNLTSPSWASLTPNLSTQYGVYSSLALFSSFCHFLIYYLIWLL